MSAGTKIVQMRSTLRALLRYASHRRDCLASVGGARCTCGFDGIRHDAAYHTRANPGATGGPPSPVEFANRHTARRYE